MDNNLENNDEDGRDPHKKQNYSNAGEVEGDSESSLTPPLLRPQQENILDPSTIQKQKIGTESQRENYDGGLDHDRHEVSTSGHSDSKQPEERQPQNRTTQTLQPTKKKTEKKSIERQLSEKSAEERSPKSSKDEELIRLALHRNPYFTCLDEEQIERFIDETELVSNFRPGQAIIVEGPSSSQQTQPTTRDMITTGEYGFADIDDLWWDDTNATTTAIVSNDFRPYSNAQEISSKSQYLYVIRNGTADVF